MFETAMDACPVVESGVTAGKVVIDVGEEIFSSKVEVKMNETTGKAHGCGICCVCTAAIGATRYPC
jgi:hypothetical protein